MKTKIPYPRMTRNEFTDELIWYIEWMEFVNSRAKVEDIYRMDGGKIAIKLSTGEMFEIAITIPIPEDQMKMF